MVRFLLSLLVGSMAAASAQQPNIVFIISDDAGFADWGFMDDYTGGVSPVPTPRLDELRARGVLFTNAYTAAVCSPSRAAIITGSYQQRIGYEFNINNLTNPNGTFEGLRSEDVTIFERMGERGYTTGAIGKWHVGGIPDIVEGGVVTKPGNRPPRQGVEEFYGILRGSRSYSVGTQVGDETRALREMSLDANGLEVNIEREAEHAGEYVTNTFGQGAVDFIDRHYADIDPFFLYVSFTCPHSPVGPSPDRNEPGITTDYGSMMFTMDQEIGRIMDKIADPAGDGSVDLTGDTLIIFINDNGGAQGATRDNSPLRDWKGSTYEGGIRVPMIFAGAGVTAVPGSVYSEPVHSFDILPTCYEMAGGAVLSEIDGVNLLPFANGVDDGAPHEAIVIRNRNKYGVRLGDWKLTRNGSGVPELFDLTTNIAESSAADLAAANPDVVSLMLEILTEHEVGFDKPRFHGLSSGVDSINRNDHFIFAPTAPTGETFTPDLALVGAGLRNGDFESPAFATDQHTFAEADDWMNIGTGTQADAFIRTNQTRTSPQNAVMSEAPSRVAGLDTGHTIAAGEVFGFSYWWRDASNWNDGADRMGFTFYTTADDTVGGTVESSQEYLSGLSTANSTYELADGTHTATAGEDGKRLFVSFRGVDGNGATGGFARVDDVSVARGTLGGGGGGTAMIDWAAGGAWTDADTGLGDTLLDIDPFAGAVLEFPTTDGFSYIANNSLKRATGQDFMLNKLALSGTAPGAGSATITGEALLFTESLVGAPAVIENSATGLNYEFTIEAPIVVWEDLAIGGDGSAGLIIAGGTNQGQPDHRVIVNKQGTSTLTLGGDQPIRTSVDVREGALKLDDASFEDNTGIWIREETSVSGSGQLGGTLDLSGEWVIDLDAGDRIDMETLELDQTGTLRFEGEPSGDVHVFASYEFIDLYNDGVQIEGLPPGYFVDFAFEGRQIALTNTSAYTRWAETTSGLSGAEAAFDADANGDGVPNGAAFFLGAENANVSAIELLPGVGAFHRRHAAVVHPFTVLYSTDLETWRPLIERKNDSEIDYGGEVSPGVGWISIDFPDSVDGRKLFSKLVIEE